MTIFLPTLLTLLQQYGYPALWLCVCIASFGAPLPTVLLLLAMGAFAALGDFNIVVLVLVTLSASVCGDSLGYLLGRRIGSGVFDWLERQRRFRFFSAQRIAQSHVYFKRSGGLAIFLTRFLFVFLGGITNIVAGAERYPYEQFLLFDFTGEVLSACIPLALGYIFGASWEAVGDILAAASGLLLALALVVILSIQLVKMLRRARTTAIPSAVQQQAIPRSHETIPLYPKILGGHIPSPGITPQGDNSLGPSSP